MTDETKRYPLPEYVHKILLEIEEKREGFLRAWLQFTKMKPTEAVMVIRRTANGDIQTWFERKTDQK